MKTQFVIFLLVSAIVFFACQPKQENKILEDLTNNSQKNWYNVGTIRNGESVFRNYKDSTIFPYSAYQFIVTGKIISYHFLWGRSVEETKKTTTGIGC